MVCREIWRRNTGAIRLMSAKQHCQLPTGGQPMLQNTMQVFALYHRWAVHLSATGMTER